MDNSKINQINNSNTAKKNGKSRKMMLSQSYSKIEKSKKAFPKRSKKNSKLATLRSSKNKPKSSKGSSKPKKAKASTKDKKLVSKKRSKKTKVSSRELAIKALNGGAIEKETCGYDESDKILMQIQHFLGRLQSHSYL